MVVPVYILMDSSGSMHGEAISSSHAGIQALVSAIRQDDHIRDEVRLSVITFDQEARIQVAPTSVSAWPNDLDIQPRKGAPSFLGKALSALLDDIDRSQNHKAHPLVFVFSDGRVTDVGLFNDSAHKLKSRDLASIVVCLVGSTPSPVHLGALTDQVLSAATVDASTFANLLRGALTAKPPKEFNSSRLPSPPAEIQIQV